MASNATKGTPVKTTGKPKPKPVVFGGYTLTDEPGAVFESYYKSCVPLSCQFVMTKKPDAPEVILLLLGLIGGLTALGKLRANYWYLFLGHWG